ncbi:MAG: polyphosphate kinase 2 family protein [Sphingomonadales bacterium]|nr:polyphosphate kinase 2 family protein [Sphingomonadales bacterium]
MKIATKDFVIAEGAGVDLKRRKTRTRPVYRSQEHYAQILADHVARLRDLQERHYAANRHALLFIFQAMDAAGKDGVIRHVMSGINPQGCQVSSFKHPSAAELEHDFLWRTAVRLPERGQIGIFNRSYYEEVLVVKVHREILAAEGVPPTGEHGHVWRERYRSITGFERHLHANGTRIVKIFLHLSKEEQRQRFLARIEQPHKNWKFSDADLAERQHWKAYRRAYEDCIAATSTATAPWYVVPADDKANARLIVSQIVREAMEALDPQFPAMSAERQAQLAACRARLLAEGD